MADEPITEANPILTETSAADPIGDKPKTRALRKRTARKSEKAEALSGPAATKVGVRSPKTPPAAAKFEGATTKSTDRKRTKYTPAQRASILASIEKAMKDGKTTLKAALRQAEVSEQTYYNWKNAAKKTSVASTRPSDDDLATLVALEAENLKLRRELASRLRAENEELRKRLGLA